MRERLLREAGRGRGANAIAVKQDYTMEDIDDCAKLRQASEVMKRGEWRKEAGNRVYRDEVEGKQKRYMVMCPGKIDLEGRPKRALIFSMSDGKAIKE